MNKSVLMKALMGGGKVPQALLSALEPSDTKGFIKSVSNYYQDQNDTLPDGIIYKPDITPKTENGVTVVFVDVFEYDTVQRKYGRLVYSDTIENAANLILKTMANG